MKKEIYNEIDACLELLSHLHLSGELEALDDELKKEIVESFKNTNRLFVYEYLKRPVIHYEDEEWSAYMWGDSYRDLSDAEYEGLIKALEEEK